MLHEHANPYGNEMQRGQYVARGVQLLVCAELLLSMNSTE